MKKLLLVLSVGLAVALFGCAGVAASQDYTITELQKQVVVLEKRLNTLEKNVNGNVFEYRLGGDRLARIEQRISALEKGSSVYNYPPYR